ncbi:MAG: hypothetical protein MUO82_01025 [Candidatus Thermoplasmatota archaeon]|nr:hypothetical protein [Candidatus Thermoplasmatota archaeon]
MKNKIISSLILLLIFLPSISLIEIVDTDSINPLNGGWIEEREGIKILHISGSSYEMGYQHGFLLKEEIKQNLRILLNFFKFYDIVYDDLLQIWEIMKGEIPVQYFIEIKGIANGSGLSIDEIGVLNIMHDATNLAL